VGCTSQLSHHRAIRLFMMVLISAGFALAIGEASAQTDATSPTIYRLNAGSGFQQGCFPPCLCPLLQGANVRGTFTFTPKGSDGLFNRYTVDDVTWIVSVGDRELLVTGSGTYTIGGEFAVQQQLVLDLKVGDDPVQHFDSGLAPGSAQFPDINVTISIHGQVCFDTVFLVDASPVPSDQIHPYALLPESTFQRGCFPPCLCALGTEQPISGTFTLVNLGQGPLFVEFAVVNIDWLVIGPPGSLDTPVHGAGMYRVGGEFAAQQQLSLDLQVDDENPTHFDSGLVVGGGQFPRIDSEISMHGLVCFDTAIDVHALPAAESASAAIQPTN